MTIVELKEAILKGTISNDFLILVCPENYFLADQYIDEICKIKELDKFITESIYDSQTSTNLLFEAPTLYVVKVETFSETAIDYSQFTNTVVICNSVDKKIKTEVEDFIVEMPKLQAWQIEAYIKALCPVLDDKDAAWLCSAAENNIYKVAQELDKLLLFDKEEIQNVFYSLKNSPDSDLYSITPFALAEALVQNNKPIVQQFLKHAKYIDIEPMLLINLMLSKVKQINYINFANVRPDSIGITDKQANGIRYYYSYKNCPPERMRKILSFLSSIDLRLKSGLLELSKSNFMDYLICNMLSL